MYEGHSDHYHFGTSAAEYRNPTSPWYSEQGGRRFLVQHFHRAQSLYDSYRHVPPFEMTQGLQLSVRKNIEKGL